jgi:hypothetical protein
MGPVALYLLGVRPGLHAHRAPPREDGVLDAGATDDDPPGREVRPLDVLEELLVLELGVLYERHGRVHDLAEVVRRDLGRHPDRDAVRPVDEQIREPRRQDPRLPLALVEVRVEVHRLRAYVPEHLRRHTSYTSFRISHGRWWVAVYAPEVPLPVHQWVAQGEVLRHPRERVVDCGVAVRVVLADAVVDGAALDEELVARVGYLHVVGLREFASVLDGLDGEDIVGVEKGLEALGQRGADAFQLPLDAPFLDLSVRELLLVQVASVPDLGAVWVFQTRAELLAFFVLVPARTDVTPG